MKKIYTSVGLLLAALATQAQMFPPVDTSFVGATTIKVSSAASSATPVFIGGVDSVMYQPGKFAKSKQWHDFIAYTPINPVAPNDSAYISINHELTEKNNLLGNGGGMSVFKIRKKSDGTWEKYGVTKNVDFSSVGITYANCGGISTRDGRVWTAEEWMTSKNADMIGYTDTTDFVIPTGSAFAGTTIKQFENMNWMVEIDPANAVAKKKMYNWGRFGHEGGVVMADNKTVYLTDDYEEAALYKFVATTAGNFDAGDLYVYQQSQDGMSGTWIKIDNSALSNMLNAQTVSLNAGATMFLRHEWIEEIDGKLYITETGADSYSYKNALKKGWKLPKHLMAMDTVTNPFITSNPKDSVVRDPYGRVLVLDLSNNKMSVFLEGGKAPNYASNLVHLSNPDGIGKVMIDGKTYLVIQEDLNGSSMGRVRNANVNSPSSTPRICEMYVLDLSISNPTLDDLKRLAITPISAEVTGWAASPDGSVALFNSQHPSTSANSGVYKNSLTMMISGFDKVVTSLYEESKFSEKAGFQIFPNPASRTLHLNVTTDVAVYNGSMQRVMTVANTNKLDISNLEPGVYYVQTIEGKVKKLIVE